MIVNIDIIVIATPTGIFRIKNALTVLECVFIITCESSMTTDELSLILLLDYKFKLRK